MTFEPGTPKLEIGGSSIKSRHIALNVAATRFLEAHWALLAPILTLLARPVLMKVLRCRDFNQPG